MRRGFTLIELIVSLAAGLLLFLGILQLFSLSHHALRRGGATAEITQNGRITLERISRELRQAEHLLGTLPLTSPGVNQITFQDGHDAAAFNYIRYYLSEGALHRELSYYFLTAAPTVQVDYRSTNPDGSTATKAITDDQIIAEYIQSVSFWGDTLITISISLLQSTSPAVFSTTLYARNIH